MRDKLELRAFSLIIFFSWQVYADSHVREYQLTLAKQTVTIQNRTTDGMAINDSIPGPVLHFTEGELARIHVTNKMEVETSIHWHGLLLPNREDGVPYLTTPPIQPHTTYTYEFPIKQAGTYWYHSHTGLQEQQGIYGAIVIHPRQNRYQVDHDQVVVLSDWTNENPETVLRTLKRGSDYYPFKKNQNQHVMGALKHRALGAYLRRAWERMPPMDISDVAYDAFLSNGRVVHKVMAEAGQRVRLRLVNAGASTYFYLQFAGGPMQVIASDGLDVEPFEVDRLLIAIAETYDVIIKVPGSGQYELRATAQDGSGFTSTFIGSGEKKIVAPDVAKPNLYTLHGSHHHHMSDSERPTAPYDKLKSIHKTSFDDSNPWREVHLKLTGDMERYIWSFNNKVLHEEDIIEISKGEKVRFILDNKTMMHHPIHLHGHFFRVANRHGAYAPLKHTVDVPPLGRRVIEFAATEDKDWFFHCHVLYHMKGGMSRIVHYEGSTIDEDLAPIRGELFSNPWYFWGHSHLLSQMTEGQLRGANTRNDFIVNWEWGYDDEYEIEGLYQRYFHRMFKVFGGVFSSDVDHIVGIVGVDYTLPFLIEARVWIDSEADIRAGAAQEIPITRHLRTRGEVEYDTETKWEWAAGGEIYLHRAISLIGQYHSEYGAGAGIDVRF